MIIEEEKDSGNIGFDVHKKYLSQSPGLCCNVLTLLIPLTPFLLIGYLRFFISEWSSVSFSEQIHQDKRILFTLMSLASVVSSGLAAFLIGAVFLQLSNSLHNSMLQQVTHAPMRFFYSNPLGRIINRFSKDTAMADSVIPFLLLQWLQVRRVMTLLRCSTHVWSSLL